MAESRKDRTREELLLIGDYAEPAPVDRTGKQSANNDWMAQQVTKYGDGWRTGFCEGIAVAWLYLSTHGQEKHAEKLARRAIDRFGEAAEKELKNRGRG